MRIEQPSMGIETMLADPVVTDLLVLMPDLELQQDQITQE